MCVHYANACANGHRQQAAHGAHGHPLQLLFHTAHAGSERWCVEGSSVEVWELHNGSL